MTTMLMPDVNVLVYAHRADLEAHRPYREWLDDLVNGPEPFGLSILVAVGFVRVVTNRRIFADPTPTSQAVAVIDELASHPGCRLALPAADHWKRVADLCRATSAAGKLVADAQHAAVAMAEAATWVTRDADFSNFTEHGLRWQHLDLSPGG